MRNSKTELVLVHIINLHNTFIMNLKSTLSFLLLCLFSISSFSQTVLKGHIDSADGDVIGAAVLLYKDDVLLKGVVSNFTGNFLFNKLEPGIYDLRISSLGLETKRLQDIVVERNSVSQVDAFLATNTQVLDCVTITSCQVNLDCINIGCFTSHSSTKIESEEIKETTEMQPFRFTTFPNPCAAGDYISISANEVFDELLVYNFTGALVIHLQTEATDNLDIATPRNAGVYTVKLLKDGIPFDGSQQIILID